MVRVIGLRRIFFQLGNYPPAPLPYASKEELNDDDIEDFASLTREALRLAPDKPIPHMTRSLERAGIAVAPIVLTDFDTGELGASAPSFRRVILGVVLAKLR